MPGGAEASVSDCGADAGPLEPGGGVVDVDEHERRVAGRNPESFAEAIGQAEIVGVDRGDADLLEQSKRGCGADPAMPGGRGVEPARIPGEAQRRAGERPE